MKANFRHNNLRTRRNLLLFIFGVFLCATFLLYGPTRGMIAQIIYRGATPVFNAGNVVTANIEEFFGNFRRRSSLVEENANLREEIIRMQAKVLDRNILEEKVQMLEEMFGRKGVDNRVVSAVLRGSGQSPYDTLIIDAGEDVGIRLGNLAVYAGASVIGKVVEVYPSSAKIMLFSSPQEKEIAVLIGEHKIPVFARGMGMGNFEAKVPQGSLVSVGGEVLLSEDQRVILGIVGAVEEKESMPFVKVLFRVPFNIAEIRHVEIITTEKIRTEK